MFRIIVRIIQLQFLLLCAFILCNWIAGPKDAVLWFAIVSLTLVAFAVYGAIIRNRQR
jgi:hypothetical protein